jgi:predicted peptidase
MQIRLLFTTFAAASLLVAPLAAQENSADETMQKSQTFEREITRTVRADYLLFLPKGYRAKASASKRWPLMLFLHGAGERGNDIWKVAVHGPPKVVKEKPDLPFIIVSPQCPVGKRWDNDTLLALLDDIIAKHRVDTNRVYLTGLSMGGYGTWSLAVAYPERFAAIAPICGGGETIEVLLAGTKRKEAFQSLGIWAFHGAKDPVVKVEESERMIAAFKKAGCKDVQLTVYPEAQHDSWTESYNNPALYEWFLKHERKPTGK